MNTQFKDAEKLIYTVRTPQRPWNTSSHPHTHTTRETLPLAYIPRKGVEAKRVVTTILRRYNFTKTRFSVCNTRRESFLNGKKLIKVRLQQTASNI